MNLPHNKASTKARAVPMPGNSLLSPLYADADLSDAFAIELPVEASNDLEELARAALESPAVDSCAHAHPRCGESALAPLAAILPVATTAPTLPFAQPDPSARPLCTSRCR